MNTLDIEQVQHFVSTLGYEKPFNIIFLRNDGSQKQVKGAMFPVPEGPPKNPNVVPFRDPESTRGWGSFYLDRVLFMEEL